MTKNKTITLLIAGLLVATACNFPLVMQSSSDQVDDAIAETVQAMIAKTEAAATFTPLPTLTPLPTYTPYSTQQHASPPQNTPDLCNKAVFVSETVGDGTDFNPGENFTKSWRLKNMGTCTWNHNYSLDFYNGDRMSGPKSQDLDEYVAPGEYIDILIDLEAPDDPDTYTGYWKLEDDEGEPFYQVYAQIDVVDVFAVTRVILDADPDDYSGACPDSITVDVDADITSSSAGRVTYRWEASNGITSDWYSVKFDDDGTKTVTYDWDIDITVDETFTIELYVDSPNHQSFGPLEFEVVCTP